MGDDSTRPSTDGTALVLGGGGPLGAAWMAGVLAALAVEGVSPTSADTVIGTSAGALFAPRLLAGEPPQELYERQLNGDDRVELRVTARQTLRFALAALSTRNSERSARRLGKAALRSDTVREAEVLDTVGDFLRGAGDWPRRTRLRITAVDAGSGRLRAFEAADGVPLVRAVAASCAVPVVWPPVTADGRRWLDGGTRSTTHARLARGHRHALVVAPLPAAPGPHPDVHREVAALTTAGVRVTLLIPDDAARRAMGRNLTDYSRQSATAHAGHRQATAAARSVAAALQA